MNFYGPVTINYAADKAHGNQVAKKTVKQVDKKDKKQSNRYQRRGDYLEKRRHQFEAAAVAEKTRKEKLERCRRDAQRAAESRRSEDAHRRSKHPTKRQQAENRGRRPDREIVTGPASRKMEAMRRERAPSRK